MEKGNQLVACSKRLGGGQGRADWTAGRRRFDSGEVTGEVQRSRRTTGGHLCSACCSTWSWRTGAGQEERGTGQLHLASTASTGAYMVRMGRRGHTTAVVLILMRLASRLVAYCGLEYTMRSSEAGKTERSTAGDGVLPRGPLSQCSGLHGGGGRYARFNAVSLEF